MNTVTEKLPNRTALLIAVFAGAVYLVLEIILSTMDIIWLTTQEKWDGWLDLVYISLTIVMVISYILFAHGFIVLSTIFENTLLRIASYFYIVTIIGLGILDISTLWVEDMYILWIPYASASVLIGSVAIVFGVGLIRLQDGIGELSRAAGFLEIIMGCCLVTVIFFFIGFIIMIPAIIVEILVLYRGYEYLSRSKAPEVSFAG